MDYQASTSSNDSYEINNNADRRGPINYGDGVDKGYFPLQSRMSKFSKKYSSLDPDDPYASSYERINRKQMIQSKSVYDGGLF